jgi:CheY-like chemotaxis protein
MNKLLIHSNNTSFSRLEYFQIAEQFVFDLDFDTEIDFYIDKILTGRELGQKILSADVLFIKVALSKNYLEYLGIRLAYHIRLTKSLGEKRKIPIVLIAEESIQFLGITCSEPSILLTNGIYFIEETHKDFIKVINWYNSGNVKEIDDWNNFLRKINIKQPLNYLSAHSISNEWSILRWSKIIGVSDLDPNIQNIRHNIESLLYYKFLQAKFPTKNGSEDTEYKIDGSGKLLYIDDEWIKGWDGFFRKLFSRSPGIEFIVHKEDFKDKSQDAVIQSCLNKVYSFGKVGVDIILLDLRLCDHDFEFLSSAEKTHELTGFKLLSAIKEFNPGIQVIIFTASTKVWNLIELEKAGADGFIMKESPEMSIDEDHSKNTIKQLSTTLSEAFTMSFLKEVYCKFETIRLTSQKLISPEETDFISRLKNNLDVSFELLLSTRSTLKYFTYAYLQLFQCIEDFVSLPSVFKDGPDNYVYVNGKEICIKQTHVDNIEQAFFFKLKNGKYQIGNIKIRRDSDKQKDFYRSLTNFKVSAVLIFRYGNTNSSVKNWTDIYHIRNTKAAHYSAENVLHKEDILMILDFISYFINPANQNEINISKGLVEKTFEESIALLKDQGNFKVKTHKK